MATMNGSAQLCPISEDERSKAMVDGIARWLRAASSDGEMRQARRRNFDSVVPGDRLGNNQSLRNQLRKMLGILPGELAKTPRITAAVDVLGGYPEVVRETARVTTTAVCWPAFTVGAVTVDGEGLWLRPRTKPANARIIVIPDADHSPELVAGCIGDDTDLHDQYALRLAEAGFEVLVISLIDRQDTFSGTDTAQATVGGAEEGTFIPVYTNQPHREWLHRAAYQMGRHIIGFEVQKVIAAVEAFSTDALNSSAISPSSPLPTGLFGFGEGGLIAMHAAALEPRIRATVVSGYFQGHQELFASEPLYRNVFGFLSYFDDAEMSWLVAPNALIVEHAEVPAVHGPPAVRQGRNGGAAPGTIATATDKAVAAECKRANEGLRWLGKEGEVILVTEPGGGVVEQPMCAATLTYLSIALGVTSCGNTADETSASCEAMTTSSRQQVEQGIMQRMWRQVRALESCTAAAIAQSEQRRNATTLVPLVQQLAHTAVQEPLAVATPLIESNRERLWQALGKIDVKRLPIAPKTRAVNYLSTDQFTTFEVTMDVLDPGVFAWGFLLVPTSALAGSTDRRPVVVCQHGLEGLPSHSIVEDDGTQERTKAFSSYRLWRNVDIKIVYKAFARRLAERGFVTFVPHNPYRGGDSFRQLQRQANPIGLSLFSIILEQHAAILEWLSSLCFVDATRIGFYGLSYGGKSAMRIPALLTQYTFREIISTVSPRSLRVQPLHVIVLQSQCFLDRYSCSICSADFNDWTAKNTSTDFTGSYVLTGEWEMQDWNLGNTFNYAEMAMCIAPRPFMVERGHHDGVALDHWVAWEFAKVRRGYTMLGIPNAAEIEWHNGPHTINGNGTFAFLHRHLAWPEPAKL